MQAFLDGFSAALAPDEHAAMAVDGAGWHVAHDLRIPDNVTLVLLPPYSPELNPVERVWLFLRERHLSHRLLAGYDAIVNALCTAWNAPHPRRLLSLTRYPYLTKSSSRRAGITHVLGTFRHPCVRAGRARLERAKEFEPSTPTLARRCSSEPVLRF